MCNFWSTKLLEMVSGILYDRGNYAASLDWLLGRFSIWSNINIKSRSSFLDTKIGKNFQYAMDEW